MWHWNSLWARAPGDPPAVDDPKLYQAAWTPEQALVLQSRAWDTLVTASRTWWSFWMAAMPLPGQLPAGQLTPRTPVEAPPQPRAGAYGTGNGHDHAAAADKPIPRSRKAKPAIPRATRAESRPGLQARKR